MRIKVFGAREIEQALSMEGGSREITYFKSVGNTVLDVSVSRAIFQRGREKNLGREVVD